MKEVNLSLKIEEINLVLTALGNLPFIQVNEIIAKIQTQATPQLTLETNNVPEHAQEIPGENIQKK